LVAFVDGLGFSELIRAAGEPPDALAIIRLLEDLLKKEGT